MRKKERLGRLRPGEQKAARRQATGRSRMSELLRLWTESRKAISPLHPQAPGLCLDVCGQRAHDELGSGNNISCALRIISPFPSKHSTRYSAVH